MLCCIQAITTATTQLTIIQHQTNSKQQIIPPQVDEDPPWGHSIYVLLCLLLFSCLVSFVIKITNKYLLFHGNRSRQPPHSRSPGGWQLPDPCVGGGVQGYQRRHEACEPAGAAGCPLDPRPPGRIR